jgi:hypothetical protein
VVNEVVAIDERKPRLSFDEPELTRIVNRIMNPNEHVREDRRRDEHGTE